MASNQTKFKKLRKKGMDIQRIHSLNLLHDLKHQNTLSNETLTAMAQKNLLKPKKANSIQSRLKIKRAKKLVCHDVPLSH